MIRALFRLFQPVSLDEMRARLAADAQRLHLEHETAAEHHAALAAMYRARAIRLRGLLPGDLNQ